jgi:polyhydroxyalkanoate synthase
MNGADKNKGKTKAPAKESSRAFCHLNKRVPVTAPKPVDSNVFSILDRDLHAFIADTFYFAPPSVANTCFDWWINLSFSPGRQMELAQRAKDLFLRYCNYQACLTSSVDTDVCVMPMPHDRRFDDESWEQLPYKLYQQAFLTLESWWDEATRSTRGVSKHHGEVLAFLTRQVLDIFAPLNFPHTNPIVVQATQDELGMNFVRGFSNLMEDSAKFFQKDHPPGNGEYRVGVNLGVTQGKVIYQNRLIELIQYSPTTKQVQAEPILIVPAWIMKYYILDLSPENSLVKYLVDHGHTVFMISWKNPDKEDAELGLEDYLNLGIMASIDAITQIVPGQKINAAGYCLGGTLLSAAVGKMSKELDERIQSLTLFASQIDFEEAGELLFFIDEAQLAYLEDSMHKKGYLETYRMAGTFYMLRSYDLVWSRLVENYLLGKKEKLNDLMTWNKDATRMPYKMHSEYLRRLYLNNDLSEGRYVVGSKPVELNDIQMPIFSVATLKDHISPWESVYKIHLFTDTDVTFVLTSGGHNAGIVSEPGHKGRHYQLLHHKRGPHLSHKEWREKAPDYQGSWWPAWHKWLVEKSMGKTKPPRMGNASKGLKPLRAAPGEYVLVK